MSSKLVIFLAIAFQILRAQFQDSVRFSSSELDGEFWAPFMFATMNLAVKTEMACASICRKLQSPPCHGFQLDKQSGLCHLGRIDNTETSFLPAPSGTASVFIDSNILASMLQTDFYILTSISDKKHWENQVFDSRTISEGNLLGCSNYCKSEAICDFFAVKKKRCYLGNSNTYAGSISDDIGRTDIYAVKANIANITTSITFVSSEVLPAWSDKIKESRNEVFTAEECRGYCVFEGCEFYIYETWTQDCHLGITSYRSTSPAKDSFSNPSEFGINSNLIEAFPLTELYLEVLTQRRFYGRFIYRVIAGPITDEACMIHCQFDPMNRCDLYILNNSTSNTYCNLGDFDHSTGSPISISGFWSAMVLKTADGDPRINGFSKTITCTKSEFDSHLDLIIESSNELECSQQAALRSRDTYNFGMLFAMVGQECQIATFGDAEMSVVDSGTEIMEAKIHIEAAEAFRSNVYAYYTNDFTTDIVKQYVFETIVFSGSNDVLACLVKCELSLENCEFFVFEADNYKCHLGNLADDTRTVVTTPLYSGFNARNGFSTFSNSVYQGRFGSWTTNEHWNQFLAEDAGPMADRNQCAMVCYHDAQCDFVNFANGNCYFGDLSATSPLPGAPPMTTTGWIKHMTKLDPSGIERLFEARVGDVTQPNGLIEKIYWARAMISSSSGYTSIGHCMTVCLLSMTWCQMTFQKESPTDNVCFFGTFIDNIAGDNVAGRATDASTFYIRNDLDFGAIMSENMESNCGSCFACLNSGYHTLTAANDKVVFMSNDFPTSYSNNEECYWGIYASGATQLKLVIEEAETNDPGDGFNVFMGLSTGAAPFKVDSQGTTLINSTTTIILNTEFLVLKWFSDASGTSSGIIGYIERLG